MLLRSRFRDLALLIMAITPLCVAHAEPVKGWHFITWSVSSKQFKATASAAGLSAAPANKQEAEIYRLPQSVVPFAVPVRLYGQKANAYPIFRDNKLIAVRFVVERPAEACKPVLAGLTADFGPPAKDTRGFSNFNWPTTAKFGLTVPVTPEMCWPLFSKPGI